MNNKQLSRLLYFIIIVLLLTSCKPNSGQVQTRVIDLTQPKEVVWMKLSEIAESIQYIPLESDSSLFISSIKSIQISENYILVVDRLLKQVLLFDKYGKFLHRIGNRGKGPGEYPDVFHATITPNEKRIIVSVPGNDFMVYSPDGIFEELFPKSCIPRYTITREEFMIHYMMYPNTTATDGYSIILTDYNGKIISKLLNRGSSNKQMPRVGCTTTSYTYSDTTCFWEYLFDTIYGVSDDQKIHARWVLNLPKDRVKMSDYYNVDMINNAIQGGKFSLSGIVETKDWFFVRCIENVKRKFFLYNKETNKIFWVKGENKLGRLILAFDNDIDNGLPFWPSNSVNSNKLLMIINPNTLLEHKEYLKQSNLSCTNNNLSALLDSLDEMDNQVLMLVTLKK